MTAKEDDMRDVAVATEGLREAALGYIDHIDAPYLTHGGDDGCLTLLRTALSTTPPAPSVATEGLTTARGWWSYDTEEHWLVFTEAGDDREDGASVIIAKDVPPSWASYLLQRLSATPPAPEGPRRDGDEGDGLRDERVALEAGTHKPAVDDFGNQYLAPVAPAPEGGREGLDVERLARVLQETILTSTDKYLGPGMGAYRTPWTDLTERQRRHVRQDAAALAEAYEEAT